MRLLRNELTSDRVLKSLLQERRGPSVSQPILTLNRSAYQVNLQDPAVNVNAAIVAVELESMHDILSRDQKTGLFNKMENRVHHIPIIISGNIDSEIVNKKVNHNKRNLSPVNGALGNNFQTTGNSQLSRVVILSDSHLKGCTERINNYLSGKYGAIGLVKPGMSVEELLDKSMMDLDSLKKIDVSVLSAGANVRISK
jgi:hypothetical protein